MGQSPIGGNYLNNNQTQPSSVKKNITEPCGTDFMREETFKNDPLKKQKYEGANN